MIKRTSRALIFEYVKIFPVVAIIGPRQSGKTTLTQELPSETWGFFDLEKGADFDMISRNPDLFLRLNPKQIVVDEAQILRGLDARGVPDTPYHYRTKRGLKIDLILEGRFGIIPIEIKYASRIKKPR